MSSVNTLLKLISGQQDFFRGDARVAAFIVEGDLLRQSFRLRMTLALIALLTGMLSSSLVASEPLQVAPEILESEQQRIAAIDRAIVSAVSIFVPGGAGGGSGVLISPEGYALTNFHVSSPAGNYMRCGLSDGNIYDAVIVGIDPVGDLALIKLLGRDDFPYAELADSDLATVGDWCMVIGNPFLVASNLQPTVTVGILSGVGRYQEPAGTLLEYANCLQTDASINPGNSGGPLYDSEGRLLGIVGRASFEKRGRVNVGVGYAISINQAKNFLGYLHSGRVVDHATLGATVATADAGGAVVSNILEFSDAYRRGLRYSSEVLQIDGRVVNTANEVLNVLATLPSQWRVKVVYREKGQTVETLVRLRSVHRQDELLEKMAGAMPPPPPRKMAPRPPQGDGPPGNDGDSPDKEGPEGEDSDAVPVVASGATGDIPEAVLALYAARRGFANYHFNELKQKQFIEALRQQFPGGDDSSLPSWSIQGETDDQRPVSIELNQQQLSVVVGDTSIELKTRADAYENIEAKSLAGIGVALDAWRRMLHNGPKKFGETVYFGSMPLGGERPLRDCILANDGELEVRWLSHPDSKLVEAVEVFADRDEDPAELWLTADRNDPQAMPTVLELRYGTESVIRVNVQSWQVLQQADGVIEDAKQNADQDDLQGDDNAQQDSKEQTL